MSGCRETLSLFRFYHWKKSFWNGHYKFLIKTWGWRCLFGDTWRDFSKLITKKRFWTAMDNDD